MDVKIVIDGKEHQMDYLSYRLLCNILQDKDDTYAELFAQMTRGTGEDIWSGVAKRQFMKEETFFFLFENGGCDVVEALIASPMGKRHLTREMLEKKWWNLTGEAFDALAENKGEYERIPESEIVKLMHERALMSRDVGMMLKSPDYPLNHDAHEKYLSLLGSAEGSRIDPTGYMVFDYMVRDVDESTWDDEAIEPYLTPEMLRQLLMHGSDSVVECLLCKSERFRELVTMDMLDECWEKLSSFFFAELCAYIADFPQIPVEQMKERLIATDRSEVLFFLIILKKLNTDELRILAMHPDVDIAAHARLCF